MVPPRSCLSLLMLIITGWLAAQAPQYGIVGRQAPRLEVTQWDRLPAGKKRLEITDYRGKVVYLYFFQAGCPACRTHGFPLLKKLASHYRGKPDVVFLAVQTVFEGFDHNTRAAGKAMARNFGLDVPIGFDAGPDGKRSSIVDRYNTGGTPWVVMLDKDGVVRFNGYGMKFKPADAVKFIDTWRQRPPLVGSKFGTMTDLEVMGAPWDFSKRRFTLVRWWARGCRFCAASLPALEALRRRHQDFDVLAVFHPKPIQAVDLDQVWADARRLGFGGKIAADPEWKLLTKLRARGLPTAATSVSLLVDREGIIRWVHQGPRLHQAEVGGQKFPAAAAGLRELQALIK